MLTYGHCVKFIVLSSFHHPVKFRQDDGCDAGLIGNANIIGVRGGQQLDQLDLDALLTNQAKIVGQFADGSFSPFLYGKAQLGGETDGTHHTKGILTETLFRVTHATDDLMI